MASSTVLPKKPGAAHVPPRLRDATTADAEALARLYEVARPGRHEGADAFREWLTHNSVLLVEDGAGTVLAALKYREGTSGWVVEPIATRPDHRGQGYGRWLMTMLEADAIRTNVPYLAVKLSNPSVLSYYHRLGYRAKASDPLDLEKRVGGVWQKSGSAA